MRTILTAFLLLAFAGCDSTESSTPADVAEELRPDHDLSEPEEDVEAMADLAPEAWVEPEGHPIGMEVPPFALEDLNPNSATYGQLVSSADLAGKPYSLIFLDSRCPACADVADALWAAYQEHPTWWDSQPTFAVERAAALEKSPESVDDVVDGNGLPYLADTVETDLWMAFLALNHDFFTISPDGKLEVWLELYLWPEDLQKFLDHMTERYGE